MPSGPHDEFLELCAVSTSGQLSEEEQNRLQEHLAVSPACRAALGEYESVVNEAIPAIGAEQSARIDPGPGFSQSKAEKAFFERLSREEGHQPGSAEKRNGAPAAVRRVLPIAPESTWRHRAHRDVLKVHPRSDPKRRLTGVFATRSPDRPNPIGLHQVVIRRIAKNRLRIGPIEAIDGTPVIDIKPVLCEIQES